MANTLPKDSKIAKPRQATEGEKPLVNENSEEQATAPSYEQLVQQLSDSREEVKRIASAQAALRDAVTERDKQIVDLTATLAKRTAEQPTSANGGVVATPENYKGPSQAEIYLALVSGFTSRFDPLVQLDNTKVRNLGISLGGIAEVFYSEATKRHSFQK